jgi:hypothetical protein
MSNSLLGNTATELVLDVGNGIFILALKAGSVSR